MAAEVSKLCSRSRTSPDRDLSAMHGQNNDQSCVGCLFPPSKPSLHRFTLGASFIFAEEWYSSYCTPFIHGRIFPRTLQYSYAETHEPLGMDVCLRPQFDIPSHSPQRALKTSKEMRTPQRQSLCHHSVRRFTFLFAFEPVNHFSSHCSSRIA